MTEADFKIEMAKVQTLIDCARQHVTTARCSVPYMHEGLVQSFDGASRALSTLTSNICEHIDAGPNHRPRIAYED